MLKTRRQIPAPTAWNLTFDLAPAPHNNDEFVVRGAASDSTLIGSRPYSQRFADMDLHGTSTDGSTKIASEEDNSLHVPRKQRIVVELRSETTDSTSHFEEAMHFSDHGSPSLKGVDAYVWDVEDDAL